MVDKKIYAVVLAIVVIFLAVKLLDNGPSTYSEVLPEAGYCISNGLEPSYTTIEENGLEPVEYCRLQDFCEVFEATSVLTSEPFNQSILDEIEVKYFDYDCFQEEAQHTQRDFGREIPINLNVKSKFICCNKKVENGEEFCEPNICGGRFTGAKDEFGCNLYGVQLCHVGTSCSLQLGKQVCDPAPSCDWETEETTGTTFFTKLDNCGVKLEDVCGKTVLSGAHTFDYNYANKNFVQGCGGMIVNQSG